MQTIYHLSFLCWKASREHCCPINCCLLLWKTVVALCHSIILSQQQGVDSFDLAYWCYCSDSKADQIRNVSVGYVKHAYTCYKEEREEERYTHNESNHAWGRQRWEPRWQWVSGYGKHYALTWALTLPFFNTLGVLQSSMLLSGVCLQILLVKFPLSLLVHITSN